MIEKAMIKRALRISNHVQSHAAELLGIGKSGLNQKIKKFNLEVASRPQIRLKGKRHTF
jgi:two-component system NtrC family response regulator